MEIYVDLNFRFESEELHSEAIERFDKARKELTYEKFSDFFSESTELSPSDIQSVFSAEMFKDLFSIERAKSNDKKISLSNVCGSSCLDAIPEFMKLINLAGGKPLTCKATGDEAVMVYKYSKKGVSISEEMRLDYDY